MRKLLVCLLLAVGMIGCTENMRAKAWGGKMTVNLPEGKKLVLATWKNGDLWYMYRTAHPDEQPESYTFEEDSTWGVAEGRVIFKERF